MMKKILQIILITTLAMSGFFYSQTTIGVKHPPAPPPYEIWHLRGFNNEPNLSVLFKNQRQTTSIDMCYGPNNRLYAVWIDTNTLGKPVPCYAFFDEYGWTYFSTPSKKENGYSYIGYNDFQNTALDWSATKIRIASSRNRVIAVYVVKTRSHGMRLYYSILYNGNDVPAPSITCNPVNNLNWPGQEDSPDLASDVSNILYSSSPPSYPSSYSTVNNIIYLTYIKEVWGRNEVCVSRFIEDDIPPINEAWCFIDNTSPGYMIVNSSNLFSKSNPRIAFRRENLHSIGDHFPFSIVYQATVGTNINNVFYTRYDSFMRYFKGLTLGSEFTEVSSLPADRTQPHLSYGGGDEYYLVWVEKNNSITSSIAFTHLYNNSFVNPKTQSPGYTKIPSSDETGTMSRLPFIQPVHVHNVFPGHFVHLISWDQTKDSERDDTITKITCYYPPIAVLPFTQPFGAFASLNDRGKRYSEIQESMSPPYNVSYDTYSHCRMADGIDGLGPSPIIFGVCMGEDKAQDSYFGKLSLIKLGVNPPPISCVQANVKLKNDSKPWQNWQFVNENGSLIELKLNTQGFDIANYPPSPPTFLYAYFDPPLQYRKTLFESIPEGMKFKATKNPWEDWTPYKSNGNTLLVDKQTITLLRIDPQDLNEPDKPQETLKMTFFTNISPPPLPPNLPSHHFGDINNVLPLHFYNFFWLDSDNGNLPLNLPPNIPPAIKDRAFVGLCLPSTDFIIADDKNLTVDIGWYIETTIRIGNPYVDYTNFTYSLFLENPEEMNGLTIIIDPPKGSFDSSGYTVVNLTILAAKNAPLSNYLMKLKCMIFDSHFNKVPMAFCQFKINVDVKPPILSGKKIATKSYGIIGDFVDYIITIKNLGYGDAHNVEILDPLPRELRFVSSMPDATLDGTSLKWKIDKLTPGQTFSIRLRTKIRDDLGLSAGYIIINTARFKSQLDGFSSNVSVMIQPSVPGSTNPQAEFVIKNIKKGNIIYASEPMEGTLKVISGSGPFTASIMWGDSTKPEEYAIGETNTKNVSHTYDQPGDYTIITTVRDDYGKFTNIYKHIRVISR